MALVLIDIAFAIDIILVEFQIGDGDMEARGGARSEVCDEAVPAGKSLGLVIVPCAKVDDGDLAFGGQEGGGCSGGE